MRISVIGAGSWGSAIAWLLGSKGEEVRLWARDAALAETMNARHQNPRYLTTIEFAESVTASLDLAWTLEGSQAVVLVTPSTAVAQMAVEMAPLISKTTPLVLLSKGILSDSGSFLGESRAGEGAHNERGSAPAGSSASAGAHGERGDSRLLLDVLAKTLGNPERLAVLSGPNHAEEVAQAIPSAAVVVSTCKKTAEFFQQLFATPSFRLYTSADTVGVQLCGAAKNIIAIACGLALGLGAGDNTIAMLMTRGLAEISRLTVRLGGDPLTCMGLAGMGDLIATCTSEHSRNRSFGLELAKGGTLEAYQERTHMVVEGAQACRAVTDLALAHDVEMPISMVIRGIVWEGRSIEESINSLIERSFKPEFY